MPLFPSLRILQFCARRTAVIGTNRHKYRVRDLATSRNNAQKSDYNNTLIRYNGKAGEAQCRQRNKLD
jgi:hypothetical protein